MELDGQQAKPRNRVGVRKSRGFHVISSVLYGVRDPLAVPGGGQVQMRRFLAPQLRREEFLHGNLGSFTSAYFSLVEWLVYRVT